MEELAHILRLAGSVRQRTDARGNVTDEEFVYRFWFDQEDMGAKDVDGSTRRDMIQQQDQIAEYILVPGSGNQVLMHVENLGRTLFDLFLPRRLQSKLRNIPAASALVIDTTEEDLPWELLHDGAEFISARLSIGRLVYGSRGPKVKHARAKAIHACVVGNPTKDLRRAEDEAREVASVLQEAMGTLRMRYDIPMTCRTYIGSQATKREVLQNVLLSRSIPCDILHYAGHGRLDGSHPESSSLSLSDGELRVYEIDRMTITPIVFANACNTGVSRASARHYTGYSQLSGIATAFIKGGATGVIGTLWPVHDQVALTIARHFYESLIQGADLGEALRIARTAALSKHPGNASPLAYVLFGSPATRLPLFEPEFTSGPFINDLGFEEIQRIELEHSRLELLLVNDLPWILWSELDFTSWVARVGVSKERQHKMLKHLLDYRTTFRKLVQNGQKTFVGVVNSKTLDLYIQSCNGERRVELLADLQAFAELTNFTLVLSHTGDPEIEEIELVSKNEDVLADPTQSVYVFNKQTRFETSMLTYSLFATFNPALIKEYAQRFYRIYDDSVRPLNIGAVEQSRPFGPLVTAHTVEWVKRAMGLLP